ncbi:NAD(P)/FAD-dependent oxidoreductase [Virgibacillus siamensis]|uniref:NAD(P)/FAD-dependent oxidoreductase n=1 Tax=Virgibacillus siamensis TaxID=480071 RepID=UPI000985EF8A|nr:FAD-dependent oxidoreductase [Virgibacillus siamensis]
MKKVIVIGAGILGASTAYQLAKAGAEVIIADRMDAGQATDAAAGIVAPWLSKRRNKSWYKLAKGGARIYQDLVEGLAADGETETGYSRVGALNLHTNMDKLSALKQHAINRREDAPEIGELTLLDQNETKNMFPLLSDGYSALHVSGAARVDGRALRNALLRGAEKHGARVIHGDASLLYENSDINGININNETIFADTVIAATGAWTPQLLQPLGIQFDIRPQRAQIVHLQMPDTSPENWPVVKPPFNQYMLTFSDRIVVGATQENHVGFDRRVTAGGLQWILNHAIEMAPELAKATVLETRVGFRPMTPESVPVIGAVPGLNGLLHANGLGSSGLTMGPYVGKQLANLALGNELDIDLENYDMSRLIR